MARILPREPTTVQAVSVISGTAIFFFIGLWALVGGPSTGVKMLDSILVDTHYKYFVPLLVPWTAYFVIANWVGWQYYRNS